MAPLIKKGGNETGAVNIIWCGWPDLWLQVDVGQRHLGDLVEADGQWDGAEDEQAVVDGDPHQDDGLDVGGGHLDQQCADQINHKEEKTDAQEDQVQRKSAGEKMGKDSVFWKQKVPFTTKNSI